MTERHLQALKKAAESLPAWGRTVLERAVERLSVSPGEIRAAQEDLQRRNETLAGSSRTLEFERQHYQDLFDLAPGAYLLTDPNGVIQEANLMAATMFRVPKDFLIGKPLPLFVEDYEREEFEHWLSDRSPGRTSLPTSFSRIASSRCCDSSLPEKR